MVPSQWWKRLEKPFFYAAFGFFLLGLALLSVASDVVSEGVSPAAYFFFALGGCCLLGCLLACVLEWVFRVLQTQTESPAPSGAAWDNVVFEVPTYEEAMVSQGLPPELGQPPPYCSIAVPSGLTQGQSSQPPEGPGRALQRRVVSESSLTLGGSSRRARISLQLEVPPRLTSATSDVQSLEAPPKLEPLTPPPAYEISFAHPSDDSVFFENNRTPP